MEFIGKVLTKTAQESVWSQGLAKQSLVLEESNDKQYKDSIMVEFFGEKCGLIAEIKAGDIVKIFFNPRAKEYNGRWFNSINGWKIEVVQKGSGSSAPSNNAAEPVPYDENEDLPF
jgi:single-strand DNA-binding protein